MNDRIDPGGGGLTGATGDLVIAAGATADALGAKVVTRNLRDFALTPVPVETY